jgi:UDP-N-acetylmuramate dehydrogenase
MKVLENASLKNLNSFSVEAFAKLLLIIETEEDLLSLPAFDRKKDFVLGGGSNVLFVTGIPGTAFLNRITGREIIEDHDGQVLIEAGAGEIWHELVLWSLEKGLSGLENLSLIPGLAGAAPIQNIGAYGVELSSVLEGVTAWDWRKARWVFFTRDDLITSIRLRLNRCFTPCLEYQGLRDELRSMGIAQAGPKQVSDAVIRIRKRKLPDPTQLGNAGSFFKNPIVSANLAAALQQQYPGLPGWPAGPEDLKLSAGWMIEYCGLKGLRLGDAGVSDQHALVLLNYGAASGHDIARLADKVRTTVFEEFGVLLEQEPVLVNFQIGI